MSKNNNWKFRIYRPLLSSKRFVTYIHYEPRFNCLWLKFCGVIKHRYLIGKRVYHCQGLKFTVIVAFFVAFCMTRERNSLMKKETFCCPKKIVICVAQKIKYVQQNLSLITFIRRLVSKERIHPFIANVCSFITSYCLKIDESRFMLRWCKISATLQQFCVK